MEIGKYTTTAAVRASLGVDDSDIPDEYLLESGLDFELLLDLGEWLPEYEEIADGAGEPALRLYAQWFCALQVSTRKLAFPRMYSDGKTQVQRFYNFDLSEVTESAQQQVTKFKNLLLSFVDREEVAEPLPLFGVSTPSIDPVTDEDTDARD